MKLYSVGIIGFIASVAAMVANIERSQGFDRTNPYLFWGGQIILIVLFVVAVLYTIFNWKKVEKLTKGRFFTSIIICCLIYAIAYTNSKYALIFIIVCGITEIYLTRRRSGLVKGKV